MNVWENWGNERKFNPKLKENEHADLDKKLQMFYAEVLLTKDGLEYEPESLKSMLAALDGHLKEHDYKYSTARDRELYQSMLVLEGKVKHLHQRGNWKRPNAASALTSEEEEEEEEILWTAKIPGDSNPGVLSHTMWWKATEGSECLEAVYYIQVTGHTNEKSPNDYDEGNEREHRRYRT